MCFYESHSFCFFIMLWTLEQHLGSEWWCGRLTTTTSDQKKARYLDFGKQPPFCLVSFIYKIRWHFFQCTSPRWLLMVRSNRVLQDTPPLTLQNKCNDSNQVSLPGSTSQVFSVPRLKSPDVFIPCSPRSLHSLLTLMCLKIYRRLDPPPFSFTPSCIKAQAPDPRPLIHRSIIKLQMNFPHAAVNVTTILRLLRETVK